MNRKRTSIVWKVPKEEFSKIVREAKTLTAIAKAIGACPEAGTFPIIKKRLKEERIDYSHITLGLSNRKGHRVPKEALPLEVVLVEHSTYSRTTLKRRLLASGVLKNECSICGLGSIWNGKPISMRLDHENGVPDDHRLSNLRMICPNCDSQLPTFCVGNRAKHKCVDCGRKITSSSKRCRRCNSKSRINHMPTKVVWPSDASLAEVVSKTNKFAVAKKLGVSWQAVNNRLRIHGIVISKI